MFALFVFVLATLITLKFLSTKRVVNFGSMLHSLPIQLGDWSKFVGGEAETAGTLQSGKEEAQGRSH